MLGKILLAAVIVLAAAVAGLAAMIALQPSKFSVSRSTTVAAAPEDVFFQVNDFRNWQAWWVGGPAVPVPVSRATLEGPAAGKGAILRWSGDDEVDAGSITILDSLPPKQIKTRLVIVGSDPWVADMAFDFASAGSATTATWTWSGEKTFLLKAATLFIMSEDKYIGPQLERGLARLKTVAEQKKP